MSVDSHRAVFLSYASQDAEAARRVCEALRSGGVDVWLDVEGGLEHGDEWDAKIRRQIKECVLFIPIISANTQARHEGYFRLEWELAAQRAMSIASGVPFILPVVIDDTREPDALVPDRFRMVQWTRLRGGEVPPEVQQRFLKLWSHRTGVVACESEVARVSDSPSEDPSRNDEGPGQRPALLSNRATTTRALRARRLWLVGTAAALALLGALGWKLLQRDAPPASPPAAARRSTSRTPEKSVAVLPFSNQSADPANEYFSDGIADELRIVLQKIPGLRVAARASAWSFKGKNPTIQEVGEKLGMAYVVEGSVYKDGNRVKITARLSHAANNEELWSEKFGPLELTDMFATQSEIAQAIVTALRGRLIGESANATATKAEIQAQVQASAKGGTKNVEAHQLFLQGKFFAIQFSRENIARAIGNFRRATDLDSSFALAWAELSSALTVQGAWGMTDRPLPEVFGEARRAAGRALELEPNLAEGYAALSLVRLRYDLDWKGAATAALRALDLAPSDATIISNAAQALQAIGQTDRAMDLARQAVTLDPLNTEARNNVGYGYWSVGKFKEAEQEYRRVLELNPAAQGAQSAIGLAVLFQGRIDEAAAHIEREPDTVFRNNGLALVRWAQKRVPEADAALQAAIARADIVSYQVAETYAYRNDLDQAFAWLERARENHDSGIGFVRTDLLLRPLHSDPRWPAFLRKIGLHDDQLK